MEGRRQAPLRRFDQADFTTDITNTTLRYR